MKGNVLSLLVNKGELHAQFISNNSCTFGTAGVRRHNDTIAPLQYLFLDILDHNGFRVQVVDGDVKKALELWVVEVEGDDVISPSCLQEICDERARPRRPHFVP